MTTQLLANPVAALYSCRAEELNRTRHTLFRRVDAAVPGLSSVLSRVFEDRGRVASPPPIGELWPWLLADIAGLEAESVTCIAEPWLALYTYTVLLDRQADEPSKIDPAEILAASLLFEMGIGDLWRLTAGTPWCDVIRSSVHKAVSAQIVDVRLRNSMGDIESKRRSAAEKNSGIVAGAAAFAAVGTIDPAALVAFARAILLPVQHLDDLADFAEDYGNANYTPLLVGAGSLLHLDVLGIPIPLANRELLSALIRSGSLSAVVQETRAVLTDARTNVADAYPTSRNSLAKTFFTQLDCGLADTEVAVLSARKILLSDGATELDREHAVRVVQRRVEIVAQST